MSTTLSPTIDTERYAALLHRTLPRVIRSEEENDRLTAKLLELDERDDLSPEEEELAELLTVLIQQFEEQHYSLDAPSPHQMLHHLMEARGLTHKDVWRLFGSKGIASEVLNGKRSISKAQAKRLAEFFHVSAELFI
jgi:HTH-type transcriptional regulator/antitoxin HigA